ncbi:ApbE family lipoprotein [Alkaliphilus oremlandii OhILAs]|uniref:FAD:protein FMN transferase n=2 Tax=Alkaliphilus oremlandii TaxID=461876 RepID=A8MEV7_ALKOO|nr:ApbE family lipoprotein [Alkaliphilus oremlandii OhILAs]
MKKVISIIMIFVLTLGILSGCNQKVEKEYSKYTDTFFDTFDTLVQVVGYTETEEEFKAYFEQIKSRFEQLHKLYDIYNNYEGLNNVKTINDNAGIKPVEVQKEIIDLIVFAKEWYSKTNGKTNIAMGSVLKIWHDYRQEGESEPEHAKLPPMEQLLEAAQYTNIDDVIVDTKKNTVYLADKKMALDVGAVAKGYATEVVAKEMMKKGFTSGIISAGGNVRVLEKPLDGVRERWGIGIQNPDQSILPNESSILETIFINNASVVTSGDYQRYYMVDGKTIHHLIDPETLMPGEYYRAVTVVTVNSGAADALSTAVFLTPYAESKALVEGIEGVEALWIMKDGSIEATDGMKAIMKSHGATGSKH